ncbi:MAG: hypothetical protein CMJ78_04290 [Planctomycetaceae bacterium]|nr:hypothetical protein [Planctomycetaceae bacterium]
MLQQTGLPLLHKGLLEQANRRRTYVIRVTYSVLLFGLILYNFQSELAALATQNSINLGVGQPLFEQIFVWQAVGIFVFMPPLTCAAIAGERERGTMDILFTTKLSPAHIIMEKTLAALMPMWFLLLVSMPITGFAYSLGGVSTPELIAMLMVLLMQTIQMAIIGIFCSAKCFSVARALLLTYFLQLVVSSLGGCITGAFATVGGPAGSPWVMMLVPVMISTLVISTIGFKMAMTALVEGQTLHAYDIRRDLLYDAGAYVSENWLDSVFRGLITRSRALPETDPVLWRERFRRWKMSRSSFLLSYSILMAEAWLLLIMLEVGHSQNPSGRLAFGAAFFSLIAIPIICSKSAGVATKERQAQTLEVLASTPIPGKDIMHQKLYEVRKSIQYLLIPVVSIFIFEFYWKSQRHLDELDYIICAIVYLVVLPHLLMWFSFFLTDKLRTSVSAIMVSLAVVGILLIGPPMFVEHQLQQSKIATLSGQIATSLSLSHIFDYLFSTNATRSRFMNAWFTPWYSLAFYGTAWLVLSRLYLMRADRFLGRLGPRKR